MNYACKFCQKLLLVYISPGTAHTVDCSNCRISYVVSGNTTCAQTYYLEGPVYHALIMHLDTGFTFVTFMDTLQDIVFRATFPDTKPEDALALAKRLHNLKAFL
jgi:hypothetical protein